MDYLNIFPIGVGLCGVYFLTMAKQNFGRETHAEYMMIGMVCMAISIITLITNLGFILYLNI